MIPMNNISPSMEAYFSSLQEEVTRVYTLAQSAREKGFDPSFEVEIPLAKNMAERVIGLISAVAPQIKGSGAVERIGELESKYGVQDWRVALEVSLEVAQQRFCTFSSIQEAIEVGLRVGLAYITNGVVASPLEGFTRLEIKKRLDEGEYFSLCFSGPIRSAGTTATCIFIFLCDYVRRKMGYQPYDPTETEIKRMVTELYDFHDKITNLQYLPSEDEISFMVQHLPVQIDGDPSERFEVSNYKNLSRIATNILRNGPCLVLGEGLTQKAAKFYGKSFLWYQDYGMEDWYFLKNFISLQKNIRSKVKPSSSQEDARQIKPDYTYIKDLVGGRPIFSHPLRAGGFRLRYGRCRISGFSSDAIHPATMVVLDDFVAVGTQFRTERPGKSTAVSVCDFIEGPIVKLRDGSVTFLQSAAEARTALPNIKEVLFLGDILINYGDFFNRVHKLVPCGYNEEWYVLELNASGASHPLVTKLCSDRFYLISAHDAISISKEFGVPLHPRYTYHWKDLSLEMFSALMSWLRSGTFSEHEVSIPMPQSSEFSHIDPKRSLELLGIPHRVIENKVLVVGDDAVAFQFCLNLPNLLPSCNGEDVLSIVCNLSGIIVRDKSGTYIGARMGRPEKAKMRKLTGSPHVLFPVGSEGGKLRSFQSALEIGEVISDFPIRFCSSCQCDTIYPVCESCHCRTEQHYFCPICKLDLHSPCSVHPLSKTSKTRSIPIAHYYRQALRLLGLREYRDLVKGVRGMSNAKSIPEHLVKGLLRSRYNIHVNKDGTIRFDMTEMAMTHFKPCEIRTSIGRLIALGYDKDIQGNTLERDDQILELKPQDVVLPAGKHSLEDGADKVLHRISLFIDNLLFSLYRLTPYYNAASPIDLVGHLVVALSPHTSAGNVARIIGFSDTQGFFAHPLLHCMMRRDADGDEACVILLLDAFLNFSRSFLPQHRGATQDAPLVLTSQLIPSEVDDMVFDMDIVSSYPLDLYEAALDYKNPWEVSVERYGSRLGTYKQYEGSLFTHDVTNLNESVLCSSYKSIPTMAGKVEGQMRLAERLRAVDEWDVARLVIERHFIRDIKGNLRKFSQQQFRCVSCNEKYRRPPLAGKCLKCKGKLLFTIAEGSIVKYLEPCLQLAEKYALPPYLRQTIELTQRRIEGVFGKEAERQEGLSKWA